MTISQELHVQVGVINNRLLVEALKIEGRPIFGESLGHVWQCVEAGEVLLGLVREGADQLVISLPMKEFLEFFHSSVESDPEMVFGGYYALPRERFFYFLFCSSEETF